MLTPLLFLLLLSDSEELLLLVQSLVKQKQLPPLLLQLLLLLLKPQTQPDLRPRSVIVLSLLMYLPQPLIGLLGGTESVLAPLIGCLSETKPLIGFFRGVVPWPWSRLLGCVGALGGPVCLGRSVCLGGPVCLRGLSLCFLLSLLHRWT